MLPVASDSPPCPRACFSHWCHWHGTPPRFPPSLFFDTTACNSMEVSDRVWKPLAKTGAGPVVASRETLDSGDLLLSPRPSLAGGSHFPASETRVCDTCLETPFFPQVHAHFLGTPGAWLTGRPLDGATHTSQGHPAHCPQALANSSWGGLHHSRCLCPCPRTSDQTVPCT